MSLFHIIAYPLFVISALEIALGIVLLRNNPRKSNLQKAVAAVSFFSAAFSFISAAMYMRASFGLPIDLAARLNWIGWFTVPAGLQILFYMKDDRAPVGRRIGLVLYPAWLLILGLCLFTDLIVTSGYSVIPFINHPGPLENVFRLFGSLLAVWLLIGLVRLKKQLHGIKKAQLNYFFQGVLIFGGGAAFTAGFMQLLGGFGFEPGLASFFSFPWVAMTYYAITRNRLFDIRLIFSRVLSIILLVALFAVAQIWVFKLLTPALGESFSILISLSIIGIIYYGTRINRKMQHIVQQLVVQDKYDYQGVLRESIKAIITILDLDELLDYIIASMKKSLGVDSAYLVLKEKSGSFTRSRGRTAGLDETKTGLDNTMVDTLLRLGPGVVREELAEVTSEEAGMVCRMMEKMAAELIIPLSYKGDVKGFMVLGRKGNQDPYLQSDIDLLESLAGHAAVAIENAQLYEESRRVRQSLQESEEKFRTLAETAAMAIFIHQGGNFLYANRAAEVIGGYTVEEYLTKDFMSLVHPDYIELVKTRARERLIGSNDVPRQYEFKIVRKNGEHRWVLMTAGMAEFKGKPAVMGTLIDITIRKQAEEERDQMALLIENSSDFIGMASLDGKIMFVNSAGRRLVGLEDKDDLKTMTMFDFIMKEDLTLFAEQLLPSDVWRGEFRLKHFKTGLPIPVDMYGFSVTDEKTGHAIARAAVIRDITDLKRAREERERYFQQLKEATHSLQESEEKFRTLAETTTAAIFIHQGQKLVYANTAGETMSGYSREELLQEDFWALIHPDYQELTKERGQARLRGEQKPREYEFKFIRKDGSDRWAATTAGVIEFGGKPAIIATLFDITEWKRAEEAKVKFYEESVRQYQERIEEEKRHRMEKEKIVMDLHDGIGGITTNISILSEIAQKAEDMETVKTTLSTISKLSREGIAEIRSFMHSLDSKELNWRTLAAELRNQGTNMVEPHKIRFLINSTLDDIYEQPGSLIWVNMFKIYKEALTNVIKHAKASEVKVSFEIDGQSVRLSIADNGVGLAGSGSEGRGLPNMKTRAAEIGGNLTIFLKRGTIVNFDLPLPLKYPAQGMVRH